MTKVSSTDSVTADYFDFVNYNVCRAVSEHVGQEKAAKVYERAGEIGYAELKKRELIKTEQVDPVDVLRQIAKFLESAGYMGRIDIEQISQTEIVVDMYQVSVLPSSMRLTDEGYEASHYMTNLMFAALKDYGLTADLEELAFDRDVNHVREGWTLKSV